MSTIPQGKLLQVLRTLDNHPDAQRLGVHENALIAAMAGTHAMLVQRYLHHLESNGIVYRVAGMKRYKRAPLVAP